MVEYIFSLVLILILESCTRGFSVIKKMTARNFFPALKSFSSTELIVINNNNNNSVLVICLIQGNIEPDNKTEHHSFTMIDRIVNTDERRRIQ